MNGSWTNGRWIIWRRIFSWETAKILGFNLLLSLILLEALGLAIYFAETGKLYHLSPPDGNIERPPPDDAVNDAVEAYRLHPYLGFILKPDAGTGGNGRPALGGDPPHNRYGFESVHDYPYERQREKEYLVAFFGGSVASKLATWEAENRVVSRQIATALGRRTDDVVILNFAQGGYKQPQQILTYTYFQSLGQKFDLVINVDGFNEVALAGLNAAVEVALDMPSVSHLGPLQDITSGQAEELRRVRDSWQTYRRFYRRAWTKDGWEGRFAGGFLVDWAIYRLARRSFTVQRLAYGENWRPAEDAWLHLQRQPPAGDATPGQILAPVAQLWLRSSRQLHRAQESAGGLYLHFLQPNQYYDTGREMSEEEKKVALSPQSPYARYVERGYPLLESRLRPLERSGVAVTSLVPLFDQVEEPVYADDCCHFNEFGQLLMAQVIGRVAAEAIVERRLERRASQP